MSKTIYLCYITDAWLSTASKVLVYIGEDVEDCIAQLAYYGSKHDCEMTDEQQGQLRWCQSNNRALQSQCSNTDYEWILEPARLNEFV